MLRTFLDASNAEYPKTGCGALRRPHPVFGLLQDNLRKVSYSEKEIFEPVLMDRSERSYMKPNLRSDVVGLLRRRVDSEEYRSIRQLWIAHSVAEDAHDIPGLMATLTEDCVYRVVNKNVDWVGKAGATRFYTQLLTSFPDIHFDLQNIVIGPQGVFEEAYVTGTYESQWLDLPPPGGEHIDFFVTILFPWEPNQKLFSGERIYFYLK